LDAGNKEAPQAQLTGVQEAELDDKPTLTGFDLCVCTYERSEMLQFQTQTAQDASGADMRGG
jgi:hypothetical protein